MSVLRNRVRKLESKISSGGPITLVPHCNFEGGEEAVIRAYLQDHPEHSGAEFRVIYGGWMGDPNKITAHH